MIGEDFNMDVPELADRITVDHDTGEVSMPQELLDRIHLAIDLDADVTRRLNELDIKEWIGAFGIDGVLAATRAVGSIGVTHAQTLGDGSHA